jgi:hypothetical protein
VFHVELRQFPHSARAFNLTAEQLRASFLSPWVAGQTLEWSERQWSPDRAKLTIYEGPELRPEELGMGRGWANAARGGEEVTARVLAEEQQIARGGEPLQALKQELEELCAQTPQRLPAVATLAERRWPQLRASERLALAEQAVWELLHERRVTLVHEVPAGPEPIDESDWQASLLTWASWTGTAGAGVLAIRAARVR